jgi:hypothetical protein
MRHNKITVRLDDKELGWLRAVSVDLEGEQEASTDPERIRQMLYFCISTATPSYFDINADITLSTLK